MFICFLVESQMRRCLCYHQQLVSLAKHEDWTQEERLVWHCPELPKSGLNCQTIPLNEHILLILHLTDCNVKSLAASASVARDLNCPSENSRGAHKNE